MYVNHMLVEILFIFRVTLGNPPKKKRGVHLQSFVAMVTSKQNFRGNFFLGDAMKKEREKNKMVGVGLNDLPEIHHDRPALVLILILALFYAYRRFPPVMCSVTEPTMRPPF